MPKPATGEVRFNGAVWVARVTLRGKDRVTLAMPTCSTEPEARERGALLAQLAQRLRTAPDLDPARARKTLEWIAGAPARALASQLAAVDDLLGGRMELKGRPSVPTFGEIAQQWVTGELARKYPGHIAHKRSADDDETRLRLHILPRLGTRPIDRITLDECEAVMAALPEGMAVATRRNVAVCMTRIFNLCVYPLRLLNASPLPKQFVPKAPKQAQFTCVYPSEDSKLMRHTAAPLSHRLLWGVLAREGMRLGEALALRWSALDLELGAIRIGITKTDNGRMWPLDRGVAEALRRYRDKVKPQPADLVFLDVDGEPFSPSGELGLPALLRKRLAEAGVTRPELFADADDGSTRMLRVHDLRSSFITVNLAAGASETWISDRTGHKSSAMINRYRRDARTFARLNVGTFEPLHEAIPELSDSPSDSPSKSSESAKPVTLLEEKERPQRDLKTVGEAQNPAETRNSAGIGERSSAIVSAKGEPAGNADPVETALATALQGATAAGQWEVVATLARELQARREARAGVVDLAAVRRQKGQSQ